MEDIEEYFRDLLTQHHSIDIADSEFKKALAEDDELKEAYREWCHAVGSTERLGFKDFAQEYKDNQDEVWEALQDYDDQ